jgi:hypothetical protein
MNGSFAHYGWNHGSGTKPPQLCCARETKERMVARQFFTYLLPFRDTVVASRLGK